VEGQPDAETEGAAGQGGQGGSPVKFRSWKPKMAIILRGLVFQEAT